MTRLYNQSQQTLLAGNVISNHDFLGRARGLLGYAGLPEGTAMWLKPCNNIHTWFMRFPIDAVFVDAQLRVVHVDRRLQPWRLVWRRKAYSVFEFEAREDQLRDLKIGDQLHVGD